MRFWIIFLGIFSIMALSNAPVPLLPEIDPNVQIQSFIFSAYFLGAVIATLPAGFLTERFDIRALIRYSLLISAVTGFCMFFFPTPSVFFIARIIEGVFAGIFVTATLTIINRQKNHISLSGTYMALLNAGLLSGLIITGVVSSVTGDDYPGLLLFAILCSLSCLFTRLIHDDWLPAITQSDPVSSHSEIIQLIRDEWPLWSSVIVILGITGVVQSLYGAYTNDSPLVLGTKLALMNIATIIASLIAPRIPLRPLRMIRVSAILSAFALILIPFSAIMIPVIGLIAGIAYIAQMGYLAGTIQRTGLAMGMLTTMSYLGMMTFPALGGIIANQYSIPVSFLVFSGVCLVIAIVIGRCRCTYQL
ncbi:MAG: MFS transporter [Methanospirillaceae archaeon]|nr:MFS transporter [Methanospirillaceae archaeon]